MSADLAVLAQQVNEASSYVEVFGPTPDNLKSNYRKMARVLHPDGKNAIDSQIASEAFTKLQTLFDEAIRALKNGTYGQKPSTVIKTKRHSHELFGDPITAEVSHTYEAMTDSTEPTFIKVAINSTTNDLLQAEANNIRRIHSENKIENFTDYFPHLVDTFKIEDRRANVFNRLDGFYTLREVRDHHGSNLNILDAIWMWRRLLVAIGASHEADIVHGAILPEHVMIFPLQHGLVLVDWCFSREIGQPLLAVSKRYSDLYPQEVFDKEPADEATDIYMAAQTMKYLIKDTETPRGIRAFLNGCALPRQKTRPHKAHDLLREFDDLLQTLGDPYHPRRFREFRMS